MKYRAKIDEKTCDSCLVKDGSDSLAPNPMQLSYIRNFPKKN